MLDGKGLWETNGGKGSKAATVRAIFIGPPLVRLGQRCHRRQWEMWAREPQHQV